MDTNSHVLTNALYPAVETALKSPAVVKEYKTKLDTYLAANTEKYFVVGPMGRPIFGNDIQDWYIKTLGLTRDTIIKSIKQTSAIKSTWVVMNDPFNIANVLATRYFAKRGDKTYQQLSQWYLIASEYPSAHFRYFKHGVNVKCMEYTINNLSAKFGIKQYKNLWATFSNMISVAYALHEPKIITGTDKAFVDYVQDVHTRMSSLLKNIADAYYDNYNHQRFLEKEYESFDEDNYHEAESSSYDVSNITNRVVSHLVIHGPDMKLVEFASKANKVSVNAMRNYVNAIVTSSHRIELTNMVEAILFLYLFNDDGDAHSPNQIGTNEFMIYCLKIYKRSNTINKNVLKIKGILDNWIEELGVKEKFNREATLGAFKKALFLFFVMSIQKYGR